MKIRQLNFFTVGSLVLLTSFLMVMVIWGLNQLLQTSTSTQQFYQLQDNVNDRLQGTINRYLLSGDSLQLSAAEEAIGDFIENDMPALDGDLKATLLPLAKSLQQRLSVDLRAAGKLSGNAAALLDQSEQEMKAALSSLSDYAVAANSRHTLGYLKTTGQFSRAVHELAVSRYKLLDTHDSSRVADVESKLQRLALLLVELKKLPLLGIYVQEEVDEMEALLWGAEEEAAEQEEKGDLLKQELGFLISRYPQELARTRQWIADAEDARAVVNKEMAQLHATLAQFEGTMLQRRDDIAFRVRSILLAVGLTIIVLAGLVFIIQQRIAGLVVGLDREIAILAGGDFRERQQAQSFIQEFSGLVDSCRTLQQSLFSMVTDIHQHSQAIKDSSAKVTSAAQSINQLTIEQREQTERSSDSVQQVSAAVIHVAEQTASATSISDREDQILAQGQKKIDQSLQNIEGLNTVIHQTGDAIAALKSDADQINDFIEMIQTISEQTNLLALNAAIEAARAGEQGRGFSVVADEVRSLAGKTNEVTHEIQRLVEQVSHSSEGLSSSMQQQLNTSEQAAIAAKEAGDAYQQLIECVNSINAAVSGIAVQSEQQASIVDELKESIVAVAEKAQVSSGQSLSTLQSSQELVVISDTFSSMVEGYRV